MSGVPTLYSQLPVAQQQQIQNLEKYVKSLAVDGSNATQVIKDIDAQISQMLKEDVWQKSKNDLVNVQKYLGGLKWTVEHLDRDDDLNVDREGLQFVIDRISKVASETMFLNPGPVWKGILDNAAKFSAERCTGVVYNAIEKQKKEVLTYFQAKCGMSYKGNDGMVRFVLPLPASPRDVRVLLRAGICSFADKMDALQHGHGTMTCQVLEAIQSCHSRKKDEELLKDAIYHLTNYENTHDVNFYAESQIRYLVQIATDEWMYFLFERVGIQLDSVSQFNSLRTGSSLNLFESVVDGYGSYLGFPRVRLLVFSGGKASAEYVKKFANHEQEYIQCRAIREGVENENEFMKNQAGALIPFMNTLLINELSQVILQYSILDATGMRMECQRRYAAL